jgi:hypothetical protein
MQRLICWFAFVVFSPEVPLIWQGAFITRDFAPISGFAMVVYQEIEAHAIFCLNNGGEKFPHAIVGGDCYFSGETAS